MGRTTSAPLLFATASAASAAAGEAPSAGFASTGLGMARLRVDHLAGAVYLEPLKPAALGLAPAGEGQAKHGDIPLWAKALAGGGVAACDIVVAHRLLARLLAGRGQSSRLAGVNALRARRGASEAEASAPRRRRHASGAATTAAIAAVAGILVATAARRSARSRRSPTSAAAAAPCAVAVAAPEPEATGATTPSSEEAFEPTTPVGKQHEALEFTPAEKESAMEMDLSEEDFSPSDGSEEKDGLNIQTDVPELPWSLSSCSTALVSPDEQERRVRQHRYFDGSGLVRQISAEIDRRVKEQQQQLAPAPLGMVQLRAAAIERMLKGGSNEDSAGPRRVEKGLFLSSGQAEFGHGAEFHRIMTLDVEKDDTPSEDLDRQATEEMPTLHVDFFRIGTECAPEPSVNQQKEYDLEVALERHCTKLMAA